MAKIVDLQSYRTRAVAERVFGPWKKRFQDTFSENTGLADLDNQTLFRLAQPGDESTLAFYELVMSALKMGEAAKFYYLDKSEQLRVVDIHLFLADQVRFELMKRLGWLVKFTCRQHSILEVIHESDRLKLKAMNNPPELMETHPEYEYFKELPSREKDAFIRRLLPKALDSFKKDLD